MSELKECPFCGGRAHLVVHEDDGGYRATVYCTSGAEIGCFTKMSHWALKKAWGVKSATAAWNRRPEPKAIIPNKRIPGIGKCPTCKTELCTDDKDLHYCPTCGTHLITPGGEKE